MPVYVDPIMQYGGSATFPWRESCHMFADTSAELESMARLLGLSPTWIQSSRGFVHYDLTKGKRFQAVALGAVEVSLDEMAKHARAAKFGQAAKATIGDVDLSDI